MTRSESEDRAAGLLPGFAVDSTRLTGHLLPLSTRMPRPVVGRVLLVGGAASLVNPLTGECIFCVLASGALGGKAAITGNAGGVYSLPFGEDSAVNTASDEHCIHFWSGHQ